MLHGPPLAGAPGEGLRGKRLRHSGAWASALTAAADEVAPQRNQLLLRRHEVQEDEISKLARPERPAAA